MYPENMQIYYASIKMQICNPHLRIHTSEMGLTHVCFIKLSKQSVSTLKFENHWFIEEISTP